MARTTLAPARRFDRADQLLGPYVPTLAADWLRDCPQERHRAIDCTLVFADISGFTRMTELLAARGKIGAEEMAELINGTFDSLLRSAYAYGAGLIKFGGDATLLLFHGSDHVQRAGRAAYEMQRVMRAVGSLRTSRGPVRLRMSIGIHTGCFDYFMVGEDSHRELIIAGEPVTVLTEMEKDAGPGQIVVSHATAAALATVPVDQVGRGLLLRTPPGAEAGDAGAETIDYTGVDIGVALCQTLRDHIVAGGLESEHRHVTVGFLKLSNIDDLLREQGPEVVRLGLEQVIRATQEAATANQVAFLYTDIAANGVKVLLSAGAPRRAGQDEDRMIATLRAAIDAGGTIPLRAAVTAGRVFAGDFGPAFRRTYSLMGDCVNLAARLVEQAAPGELLATEELIDAARGNFIATAKPTFTAKGKRAPIRPFSLTTPASVRQAPGTERGPMIGRGPELATLIRAAQGAAAGRGQTLELVGEPGMGKTRLLAELRAATDADVLWTDGDVYAIARPYAPFERLLRSRWQLDPDAPASDVARRLTATVSEQAPDLLPWLPLLGIVAGVELPATAELEAIDAALRKRRLEEVTSQLLGLLLTEPTVLIFNDVQLMDDASRDLIGRLAADASRRPWLLIVSRRPDGASPLADAPDELIELRPLSAEAAIELLARATESAPLPPHRLAALAERAAGNPLFLGELVSQLRAGDGVDSLPRSVEAAITARVDRLAAADRRTLRAASVLGMDIELTLLEELIRDEGDSRAGEQGAAGRARLASLSEFLEPVGASRYRFSHQLVREAAYEGLPYSRRTELHAKAAAVVEAAAGGHPEQQAELLSLHCLHGARYASAWRYSLLAARRARARYAGVEAAESYRRALAAAAHLPDLDAGELTAVDEALGELCVELGEMGAADVALRRGLRRTSGEPLTTARLQLRLARLRDIEGRHGAAMRWAARTELTLSGLDGPEVRVLSAQLAVRRARISYRQGRHAGAVSFATVAAELARETGDSRTLAEALEYGDLAAVEIGLPAGPGAEQALVIYRELGDLGAEARVRNTLGMLAYYRGSWRAALEHYRAAERAYTRSGTRWDAATPLANSAEILIYQRRFEEAKVALERAMLVWRGVNAASEVAFGEYQLGSIAARTGRFAEALQRLDVARDHFQSCGELTEVVVVDALTAECHLLAGRAADALELAEESLRRARSLGGVLTITPLLLRVRGEALLQLGRRERAELTLRDALDTARRLGADHEVVFTLDSLVAGQLTADPAEAAQWLDERERLGGELGLQVRVG